MRRIVLQAAVMLLCAAPLARATNFAVLLGSRASDYASANFDAKMLNVGITGMTVTFDPADLPADATLFIDTDPTLPAGASHLADAFTFSLTLQDNSDGHLIHQFAHPVQVDFAVTELPNDVSDFGLSRLYEDRKPPEWICEDKALTVKGGPYLCGTTNHFSYFALSPLASVPEPTAAGLLLLALPAALRRRR